MNNEFIGALFVDIDAQGKGIGKSLMDFVIDKYSKLNLAVYKDNANSVEFYKNRGFKIIQEQINEDSNHKEYIMEN
ncbi:GNAT family N-acetyltransferase [Romboutsia sp.]|uniref:GNAT family N-acetyltransferase n=1 Tax=Romboutsia sp. TaxID=1965302 RepID=UPI003F3F567F